MQEEQKRINTKIVIIWILLAIAFVGAVAAFFLGAINRWAVLVSLNGADSITLEYGMPYEEQGASARFYGTPAFPNGWPLEVETQGDVDAEILGTYTVTYSAGKWGLWDTKTRTVAVLDTQAPVITLSADPEGYTLPGETYQEEGYSAYDNYDGDITDRVTSREEDGVVYYSVLDSSGNEGQITRQIVYNDPLAPELTLNGESEISLQAGTAYQEPGYIATDNVDGDLTDAVTVEGAVNTNAAGTYTLTYTVQDGYGNMTTAVRTVTVVPVPQNNNQTTAQTGKTIYLTFDDGPGRYTQQLLDVLDKYNVKVTFFTINSGYDSLLKEEAARGHTVAIHSATHDYSYIYSSTDNYFADLNKQRQVIYDATGVWTSLLRFPGGSSNKVSAKYSIGIMTQLVQNVTEQGYTYFDWNVSSGDAGETTSTQVVYQNVISGIQRQTAAGKDSVVLQHDIKEFSVNAVEQIIQWGLENGYTFRPLTESSPVVHHSLNN